ncbi:CDP-alcohol phosphatidyltransferase family protein, partial [Actinomadura viridis]|uniref:CDP-alcohol phosphatidyltransferase family protein n=1 Tax=Actinomadura viridis TaxID=58110 RepID=UPI0031F03D63
MTVAVIIATGRACGGSGPLSAAALPYGGGPGGGPEPGGPPTLLARLCDQLTLLNVPDVHVVGRPEAAPELRADGHFITESADVPGDLREIARVARVAGEQVLVLAADLVCGDELLIRLLDDVEAPLAAVTLPPVPGGAYGMAGARVERGLVVATESDHHEVARPNAASPALLRFAPSEAEHVATVAEELAASLEESGVPEAIEEGDAAELLLAGLARFGTPVAACPGRGLVCRRAADEDQARKARAALEGADEERARLAAAVKSDDGFFSTFAVSSYSPHLVRLLANRGVAPNTVTVASMALAALAAMWFAAGTRAGMVTGAVLVYLAFVLDCVDGQLARYTGRLTAMGAWLDAVGDRAKEYGLYAGLAAGASAAATAAAATGGGA